MSTVGDRSDAGGSRAVSLGMSQGKEWKPSKVGSAQLIEPGDGFGDFLQSVRDELDQPVLEFQEARAKAKAEEQLEAAAGMPAKRRKLQLPKPKISKEALDERRRAARRELMRLLGLGDAFDAAINGMLATDVIELGSSDSETESEAEVAPADVKPPRATITTNSNARSTTASSSRQASASRPASDDSSEDELAMLEQQERLLAGEPPPQPAARTPTVSASAQPAAQAAKASGPTSRRSLGDSADSDTEEENEAELLATYIPPTLSARQHGKAPESNAVARPSDDSDTASENELMLFTAQQAQQQKRAAAEQARSASGSSMPPSQSQSGSSLGLQPSNNGHSQHETARRPDFPLTAEHQAVRPFVLDKLSGMRVPNPINYFLRDYQREGVTFLYRCWREKRGGILADDMGLGKTIQVIAFLCAIMHKSGYADSDYQRRVKKLRELPLREYNEAVRDWPTALIICPPTLCDNWYNEITKWSYLEVGVSKGKSSSDVLRSFRKKRLDVVIAGLEHVREHIQAFSELDCDVVIVDEAHRIKNSSSDLHKRLSQLQCPVRIALTGTPFMNGYGELWELLHWTNPGKLQDASVWQDIIANSIERGQSLEASPLEMKAAKIIAQRLVTQLLPPYLLRRTKELLKSFLPPKFDHIVVCAPSAEQEKVYRRVWAEPEVQALIHANDVCCGKRDQDGKLMLRKECCDSRFFTALKKEDSAITDAHDDYLEDVGIDTADCPAMSEYKKLQAQGEAMPLIRDVGLANDPMRFQHVMLSVANHLALAFPDKKDEKSKDPLDRERYRRQLAYIKSLYPHDWERRIAQKDMSLRPEYCGKWRVLKELLASWRDQDAQVLIFSKRTRLLDYIESYIQLEAYKYRRLDGSTASHRRQELVDEFNTDPSIYLFLISTAAGGVGLNLTAANKVIIFDPSWTPALDMQAMDRAHRTGQKRQVDVYRLLSQGTMEERIYERQLYKMAHSNIALEGKSEARLFADRQHLQNHRGAELFGWANLFDYQSKARVGLLIQEGKDIPGTAGGKILDDKVGVETHLQGDEIDAAVMLGMHQTSDERGTQSTQKKGKAGNALFSTEIDSILSKSDIGFVHKSSDIIGGSKMTIRPSPADFRVLAEYFDKVDIFRIRQSLSARQLTRRGTGRRAADAAPAHGAAQRASSRQASTSAQDEDSGENTDEANAEVKKRYRKSERSDKKDAKPRVDWAGQGSRKGSSDVKPKAAWPPPRRA